MINVFINFYNAVEGVMSGSLDVNILSTAMPYYATMFSLTTAAGLAIVNLPVMQWQKKFMHHKAH